MVRQTGRDQHIHIAEIAVPVVRDRVLTEYGIDSCVASTRILIEVLDYFGIHAQPVEAQVAVFNAEATAILRTDGLDAVADAVAAYSPTSPGGPWTLGVGVLTRGPMAVSGRIPPGDPRDVGHLVAIAPTLDLLLDPSIDQATREHKDLIVPPLVVRDVLWSSEPGHRIPVVVPMPGGEGVCLYEPVATGRYTASSNWVMTAANKRLAGAAIRDVRAQIAQG